MDMNIFEDLKERIADLAKMPKDSDKIIYGFIYGLKVGAETKEEVTEASN